MKLAADLRGDKELLKRLEGLKGTKIRSLFNKASRKGNKLIQKEIKKMSPRLSGKLKKSVRIRALKRSRVRAGTQVIIRFKEGKYYGAFVNYGTKHQKGQRFINNAAERVGQKAVDVTAKELARLIEGAL